MNFKKIIAVAVDLGEEIDKDQLSIITDKLSIELKIIDAKEEFVQDSVIPAIQAQAKYLEMFPVSSSLSRPIIAKKALEVAIENNCDIVIHTANQSQNSLRRLNGSIKSLKFNGYYGSPYEYTAISRKEKALFLGEHGFSFLSERKLSGDANLWCREYESGPLDNPENFNLDEDVYKWSILPKNNYQDEIKITFEKGIPSSVDNKTIDIVSLIETLNIRVGLSGAGRYIGLEHLYNQEKVLEVREMPAASILMNAYKHLEMAILTTPLLIKKQYMGQVWTQEAVEGRWYDEVAESAYSFISQLSHKISGTVTYKLLKGQFAPISIVADNPLYLTDRDNWESSKAKSESQKNIIVNDNFNDNIIYNLKKNKFLCNNGKQFIKNWDFFELADWERFSSFWNNLKQDTYMADGGLYRYRRYSEYKFNIEVSKLELLPHVPYMQSSHINSLNGDIERYYEPLEKEMTNTLFFNEYIKWLGNLFSNTLMCKTWKIKIFANRIISNGNVGKPTPEGLHRDGDDFTSVLLVNKYNVSGGMSTITDLDENFISNFNMEDKCDLCLLNDPYIKHGVSEINAINNNIDSFRDVLVVMFENF